MSDIYGRNLKIEVFGGSHDPEIGMELTGFPKGMKVDMTSLRGLMKRRAPGQNKLATARKEADEPIFTSGLDEAGATDGGVLRAIIRNTNQHSKDYSKLATIPRPSHADYAAMV